MIEEPVLYPIPEFDAHHLWSIVVHVSVFGIQSIMAIHSQLFLNQKYVRYNTIQTQNLL